MKRLLIAYTMAHSLTLSANGENTLLSTLEAALLTLNAAVPASTIPLSRTPSIPDAPPMIGVPDAPPMGAPEVFAAPPAAPAFDAPTVTGWDKPTNGGTPASTAQAKPTDKPKTPAGPLPAGIFDELLAAASKRKKVEPIEKEEVKAPVGEAGQSVKRDAELATNEFKNKYAATTDWSKNDKVLGNALDDIESIIDNILKYKSVSRNESASIELLKNLRKAIPESLISFLENAQEEQIKRLPTSLRLRENFVKSAKGSTSKKRSILTLKAEIIKMKDL